MTAHDHLKTAKDLMLGGRRDFQEVQAHALIGILEHLIGTPVPELPVYDEHPKMAPTSTQQTADTRGVELGKAYAENITDPDLIPLKLTADPSERVGMWALADLNRDRNRMVSADTVEEARELAGGIAATNLLRRLVSSYGVSSTDLIWSEATQLLRWISDGD